MAIVYERDADDLADLVVRAAQERTRKWEAQLQRKIEDWCSSHGFTAAGKAEALELIDELRGRGVASFEGLGIKVTFVGGTSEAAGGAQGMAVERAR